MSVLAEREVLNTTRQLAEHVVRAEIGTLPPSVVKASKRLIVDTLACAIGAVDTYPGRAVLQLKRGMGGRPDSTLVASGVKVPVTSAAFAHAQMGNVLDADETLRWSHTAQAIVLPAVAVAEMVGASGAELIAAVAVGFDVSARIGFSMPAFYLDPNTGHLGRAEAMGFSWAAYGAAAAAAKLLRLDADGIANALGIAHVIMPVHGSAVAFKGESEPWHKYAMYGAIAEAGVNGALLASNGYISDAHVFDELSQFYRAMGAESADHHAMVADLGTRWFIEETSLKPWPACRYINGALDSMATLVAEHNLTPEAIEHINVTVPPFSFIHMIASSVECADKLKIMTSLPYTLAMVINKVPSGPQWWDDKYFLDENVHALARKVSAEIDPGLNDYFLEELRSGGQLNASRVPMRMEIGTSAGVFKVEVGRAKGDPTDPASAMTDEELRTKVIEFTSAVLPDGAGAAMVDAAFSLENAPDLSALMDPAAVHRS